VEKPKVAPLKVVGLLLVAAALSFVGRAIVDAAMDAWPTHYELIKLAGGLVVGLAVLFCVLFPMLRLFGLLK